MKEILEKITYAISDLYGKINYPASPSHTSDRSAYLNTIKDLRNMIDNLPTQSSFSGSEFVNLSDAQRIPRHPKHTWEAVDSNGNYCRFINEPELKFGKCWVGDSVYSPQLGDVICKVNLLDVDWKTTKRRLV